MIPFKTLPCQLITCVCSLIHEALQERYVCLSEDERQDYRARLFERQFREFADDSQYRLLTTSLTVGKVTNYLGAFLRCDNDLYDAFCASFKQFDRDIHKDESWNFHVSRVN